MLKVSAVEALPCASCHGAVGFVVGPEPAVALGHAQAEEPLGAEIGIVVKGKGCGAVVAVRARGEALAARRRARAINSPCREAGWRCIKGLTYAGHLCANKPPLRPDCNPGRLRLP
jgi:hypothetical protein